MDFDIGAFRQAFPEFADASVYPDAQISFWATLGSSQVSSQVFGTYYPQVLFLYVAHQLALAGGVNGAGGSTGAGVVASKTVGSVSVSYDTTNPAERDAGWWNLTKYGKQYIRLIRIFGNGVIQL